MIKDLARVANRLDGLGLTKEADFLDALIKKIAQEESQFSKAIEVTQDEAESWQEDVTRRWEAKGRHRYDENELGYEKEDLEIGDEIWTIYERLDRQNDGMDLIKEKDLRGSSSMAFNKRIKRLNNNYLEVSKAIKEALPDVAGAFDNPYYENLRFVYGDKVYRFISALGLREDEIKLEMLGLEVGGRLSDDPVTEEDIQKSGFYGTEDFAGLKWITYKLDDN
jgi:hypothetical protein